MNEFTGVFFALTGLSLGAVTMLSRILLNSNDSWCVTRLAMAFIILLIIGISALTAFIAVSPMSRLHTAATAIHHVLLQLYAYFVGWRMNKNFIESTKNIRDAQNRVLVKILKQHANTELGRKLNLASIENAEQYQAQVPVSKYEHYQDYFDRICKGEQNLTTSFEVKKFSLSSGTTGKSKIVPFHEDIASLHLNETLFNGTIERPLSLRFAPLKAMNINWVPNWRYTEAGQRIASLSTQYERTELATVPFCTPPEMLAYMAEPAQVYIHLLFGLLDDHLVRIQSTFCGNILVGLEILQNHWRQLADDIRHGRVTNTLGIPPEVVAKIERSPIFKADPHRADQIEAVCSKGMQGVVQRLWPRIEEIHAVMTGAHAIYVDRIRWFVGPGVKFTSAYYGSSECFMGMMTDPSKQRASFRYTVIPRLGFFEFIPESDFFAEKPRTLFVDQLQVGRRYEVVVTSLVGLYRYRMGDIINVVDFFNQAPVFEFCARIGSIIDLRGEKATEDQIFRALTQSVQKWEGCKKLIEYTVTENLTLDKAQGVDNEHFGKFEVYYVIFVELDGVERPLTDAEVEACDGELKKEVGLDYKDLRDEQQIAKPKILTVKPGTFEALKKRILEVNQSISAQYKSARYQKNADYLRFLVERAYN